VAEVVEKVVWVLRLKSKDARLSARQERIKMVFRVVHISDQIESTYGKYRINMVFGSFRMP